MDSIKKIWPFLVGLVLSASLLWPLFAAPLFTHHDDVQVIRLYEMDKCFKDGQIPCRWVPDLGNLYGYPLFNYYAPLPYYFGELVLFLTQSLIVSVKTMFAVSFLGSYIFMYLLARKFWGDLGGSLSAIFYSLAPYHALDFYVRGAMGEMWGLMLFPAVLWSIYRIYEKANITNTTIFAIFLAGLLTAHNLSAMLFIPIATGWVAFLFFQKKTRKFLTYSLVSAVLGITLSSFYLFPMLFEKNLVHVDTTTYGYFSYTEHFKGFKKLFLDRSWGWGASVREVPGGEKDGLSFQIGWAHLLIWLLAVVTAYKLWKRQRFLSLAIIFSSTIIIFSILMVHPRSEFVWKSLEPLKYLQFPWRFLMLPTLFISFCAGSFLSIVKRKQLVWLGLVIFVFIFNFSYFRPEKFLFVTDKDLLKGINWDRQIKRSIFDYLPIYAKEPPAELAQTRYQIIIGDSKIYDFKEGTNWFNFKTETRSHTIIRLSQYYFPEWKIYLDGKEAQVEYANNSLGLMTLILGKGNHQITARLYDTPIRSISNIITLVSFGISIILLLTSLNQVRGWIAYYKKRMN